MPARPPAPPNRFTDAELIDMLDRKERGQKMTEIAAAYRTNKNVIAGQFHRCKGPPDKHDGTMPPGWWRAGLAKQKESK